MMDSESDITDSEDEQDEQGEGSDSDWSTDHSINGGGREEIEFSDTVSKVSNFCNLYTHMLFHNIIRLDEQWILNTFSQLNFRVNINIQISKMKSQRMLWSVPTDQVRPLSSTKYTPNYIPLSFSRTLVQADSQLWPEIVL